MTKYYEVLVAGANFGGQGFLTYSTDQTLQFGSIIRVPLRNTSSLAIVWRQVSAPTFATKPLTEILNVPPLPIASLKLISWIRSYYPAPAGMIGSLFLPKSLSNKLIKTDTGSAPVKLKTQLPNLTQEQTAVLENVKRTSSYILHGETGSGKTRIYLELAKKAVSAGKSVIILTPEISLTTQLSQSFRTIFGNNVVLVHSQLTTMQRRNTWLKLLTEPGPHIVIGARSALFSPLENLGLIVIDEAHETAYKQDQAPRYQAIRVAGKLANLHKATLVLGSATPSIVDYFIAQHKHIPILRMTKLAMGDSAKSPKPMLVDLKDRTAFHKNPHLSDILIEAIDLALKKQEQVLLFLNRRGSARVVFCSRCGWQALCPKCDIPLTYHADEYTSRCHSCGYREAFLPACPVCQNVDITLKGIGTKTVVEQITRLFPDSKIGRFDTDNIKSERFEQQYDEIRAGKIDILVGTQTLAKGLDLPKLSLVGVIMADSSLYAPDFIANEKTYQLISQVIGRVGRGHREGQAIIQTYMPERPLLKLALDGDWTTFYEAELNERKKFGFPPFYYLLKLSCRRKKSASAQQAATKLASSLISNNLNVEISDPMPALQEKVGSNYEWQIIVKSKQRDELLKVIFLLPSGWTHDIDPVGIL